MRLSEFRRVCISLYIAKRTFEMRGAPGIGKSDTLKDIARDLSRMYPDEYFGLKTALLGTMDVPDLLGYLFPGKDPDEGWPTASFSYPPIFPAKHDTVVYKNGELVTGMGPGHILKLVKRGIVFLDEFAQCGADMQKAATSIALDRRMGRFQLPDGWTVGMASNRENDKAGVVKRLSMMQNRIVTYQIQASYEDWSEWAGRNGVHPTTIGFAGQFTSSVFQNEVPAEPGPFCTPRSLTLLDEVLRVNNMLAKRKPFDAYELEDVDVETIEGHIGEKAGMQFVSWVKIGSTLPPFEDIVAKPGEVKHPANMEGCYNLCASYSHRVETPQQAAAMMSYLTRANGRFTDEMTLVFVVALMKRKPMMQSVKGVGDWQRAHTREFSSAMAV